MTQHPRSSAAPSGATPARRRPATWLLAALSLLLVTSCSDVLGRGEEDAGSTADTLLPMTLTDWLFSPGERAATADPVGIAHVSIAPMQPGDNDLTIELTDLEGAPLALASNDTELVVSYRPLEPDAVASTASPERADAPATWTTVLPLPEQAWYGIDLTLRDGSDEVAAGTVYALLPDPSVHGADALDLPASDPEAEALYQQALAAYASWESGRWRERLASGSDALVVTDYTVGTHETGHDAMEARSRYAGSFRDRTDGTSPAPPRTDFSRRVVIGDQSWTHEPGTGWREARSTGVSDFPARAAIYTGATNVHFGGTEQVDGVETRIVTFYLPQKGGQAEAWFAWWVDPETGDPLRMVMIAKMHYMVWDFHEIDEAAPIAPPPGSEIATPAAS